MLEKQEQISQGLGTLIVHIPNLPSGGKRDSSISSLENQCLICSLT